MTRKKFPHQDSGYTTIEILVTVVLASIIFGGLYISLSNIFAMVTGSAQRAVASNLAYANLRLYADGTKPTWFDCDASLLEPIVLLSRTGSQSNLPGSVTEYVQATAPYGCGGDNAGMPIRVESKVTYNGSIEVSHATYASY